ncbi:MAG: hypothetical protein ACOY4I_04075 [Bacillota bacterium]
MENTPGKKQLITKMRPDPDFKYLASRARKIMKEGIPLAGPDRDPGEIPGFYAEEHRE